MSKDETSFGLLSKVVKFVRNPATSWSDLDNKEVDREESAGKQLLKEMIERKRRNDFVRKREFDMLRKMRIREAMVGVNQDASARPSFFQSSLASRPDDRANTIKKIDEIEAQMSMQWWKTKPRTTSDPTVASASVSAAGGVAQNLLAADGGAPLAGYELTAPASIGQALQASAGEEATLPPIETARFDEATAPMPLPTGAAPLPARRPMVKNAAPAAAAGSGLAWGGGANEKSSSGFSHSKQTAVEVAEVAHDAELEEASIHFANGDDAGAEAGLLEMLSPEGSRVDDAESWMALFDLYRAIDQQDKFESAAIEFVGRFDRSAPQWFSMPDAVKSLARPEQKAARAGPVADWICPSVLGIQTVATLKAALVRAAMPWRLDWSNLKTVDAGAVDALLGVFGNWATQPVQLRFIGDPQLQKVLEAATPSGDRDTPHNRWRLRMEALRVTHRPDEFELTALDFCVTYEVSPPPWSSAHCDYKPLDADGLAIDGSTIIGDAYSDSVHSGISVLDGDTHIDGVGAQAGQVLSIELSGLIEGDAIAVLDQLEAKLTGADIMMISCAKLIRVDFSAAGTLLNWVAARQGENRSVHFAEVNRLVAAFFNVIGITEHARVTTRLD